MQYLTVRGAKQHNLQNVTCVLPRDQLVVITGPSGSGKSSLAFDTIYAEGQRRYVESLSAYARQFLDQLPKPAVDSIEGLSPAIAIEQRALGKSPRSTVGTVTEIADYLRLLFARAGVAHCPVSGRVLEAYTAQQIVDRILQHPEGTRLLLLSPILRARKDNVREELARLRRDGFVRIRLNGSFLDLGDVIEPEGDAPHDLDVVVDRIALREGITSRLTDSVELALQLGGGTLLIDYLDGAEPTVMSERLVSWEHGITLPPLEPRLFSFNSPHGACPACSGLGIRSKVDPARVVPFPNKSLREGAVAAFGRRGSLATASEVARAVKALGVDPDVAWEALPEQQRQQLLLGSLAGKSHKRGTQPYEGIVTRLERMLETGETEDDEAEREDGSIGLEDLSRFVVTQTCESCDGRRLRAEALAVRLAGHTIAELCDMPLAALQRTLERLLDGIETEGGSKPETTEHHRQIAVPLIRAVSARLGFLLDVGLDYLTLNRGAQTLSGGEGQRIRLATQIGAALVGVLYVLDEPSVGLHARDNARLLGALRRLADKGNTVLVVEHDRDAILSADYVVDMGPGAGALGGKIVAEGPPQELMRNPGSVTGPYLTWEKRLPIPSLRHPPRAERLRIVRARAHNLQDVTVEIPLGLMTAVTGVSGSGKSSLIVDTLLSAARAKLYGASGWVGPCDGIEGLEHIDKVISIDQAPIGRTPRSNPATYTGIFTHLRELYAGLPAARARGYRPGRFSFNVKGGRCEACQGDGVLRVEMHFLPDVYVACEACAGRRYNRETLEVRYRGLSIADALTLTVDDANELFSSIQRIRQRLEALRRVGLGYLKLGQPATTLSGGEAQRVKLATELAKTATGRTLYVLDEPTTGLHFSDIGLLTVALSALRDAGNSILVIEHNIELIACTDWVIDLGPEGGDKGGRVVVEGPPELVAAAPDSHTGHHLAALFAEHPNTRDGNGSHARAAGTPGQAASSGLGRLVDNGKPAPRRHADRGPQREAEAAKAPSTATRGSTRSPARGKSEVKRGTRARSKATAGHPRKPD